MKGGGKGFLRKIKAVNAGKLSFFTHRKRAEKWQNAAFWRRKSKKGRRKSSAARRRWKMAVAGRP